MRVLNHWLGLLIKLQLFCHGEKPLVVMLPDGTRLVPDKVWEADGTVYLGVTPE
jgi:hypothetical protein